MSPPKTVDARRPSSGRREESQTEQPGRPPGPRPNKRGKRRVRGETARPVLKVKLPKLRGSTLSDTAAASVGRTETTARETHGAVSRAQKRNSQSAHGSIYLFSEMSSNKARSEKAKLSVLRTISKMLEENHLIRQRLAALCQSISGSTE